MDDRDYSAESFDDEAGRALAGCLWAAVALLALVVGIWLGVRQ